MLVASFQTTIRLDSPAVMRQRSTFLAETYDHQRRAGLSKRNEPAKSDEIEGGSHRNFLSWQSKSHDPGNRPDSIGELSNARVSIWKRISYPIRISCIRAICRYLEHGRLAMADFLGIHSNKSIEDHSATKNRRFEAA